MKDQIVFPMLWTLGPDKILEQTGFPDNQGWEIYLRTKADLRLEAYYRAQDELYRWYLKGLSRWIGVNLKYFYATRRYLRSGSTCVAKAKEGTIKKIFDHRVNKTLFHMMLEYSWLSEFDYEDLFDLPIWGEVQNGFVVDVYIVQIQLSLTKEDSLESPVIEDQLDLVGSHGKYLDTFGSPVALAQGGKTNGDFSRL